ncbi:MAG: hypothetical protein Q8J89_09535 [Caulobacter sp.]|nr:hypothetical protein [Caulobacter sp.]
MSWIFGVPFSNERIVQNEHQAIGCAIETGLRHLEERGEEGGDMLPHIHIYEIEADAASVRHNADTFVASLLPARKNGELGYLLNHPAAQGRKPDQRDLQI